MTLAHLQFIYFDLGCTLVDETQAHLRRARHLAQVLAIRGIRLEPERFVRLCIEASMGFLPIFQSALATLGIDPASASELIRAVPYGHEGEELYLGVPECLHDLSRGYRLGTLANQSPGTESRRERWGIRDYFKVVLASAEIGIAKPDPRLFAEAERRAGVPPGEICLVSDRLDNDIRPAKQRGWQTIRVLQGWYRKQTPRDMLEEPDLTIGNIVDLPVRT